VRAAILPAFVQTCELLGATWEPLMRAAGLDPALLSEPDTRVPAAAFAQLLQLGVETTRRRDFALIASQALQASILGSGGQWALRQASVAESIEVFEELLKTRKVFLQPLLFEPMLEGDGLDVDLVMGVSLRILRWLLGEGWWPEAALFAYPRPADASTHRHLFGRVEFGCDINALVIDERQMSQPLRTTDPALARLIERYAAANARSATATGVMCEIIARLLPTGQCGIDEAAARQGVDRRTVHRRLAAEGGSFTDLVERIRRELVTEEIGDRQYSLTVLAERLGFSSLSTFSRWHRQTYGVAARDLRRGR
jgi:AraC-like DNA-binding protein